jgi:YVTN family beta-propeller protein
VSRSSMTLGAALSLLLLVPAAQPVVLASGRERGAEVPQRVPRASPVAVLGAEQAVDPPGARSTALLDLPFGVGGGIARLVDLTRAALSEVVGLPSVEPPDSTGKRDRAVRHHGSDRPADKRRLTLVRMISGGMAPKSIVSDQQGRVYAMNMMYGHTITVFDKHYKRIKDISDSVVLARFGYPRYQAEVLGAPVEGAVSPDGKRLYVSNYSMYGPGFGHPGFDLCTPSDRIDPSFVYAISTRTLTKTDVIQVGEVPKYLAVTPDGRRLLVGNWCSWDLSVVDLETGREVRRIPAGVAPRGIAYSPNGRIAYVSLVGEDRILVIDMQRLRVMRDIRGIGVAPRHLVMSPSGRYLYITSEGKDKPKRLDGVVLKYDLRKRRVVGRSKPLVEPRTTVISDDGRALYVVDYHAGTIVKLATRDLRVLQEKYLGYHPIGVTYDKPSDKVWVAGYGGQVWVLKDR